MKKGVWILVGLLFLVLVITMTGCQVNESSYAASSAQKAKVAEEALLWEEKDESAPGTVPYIADRLEEWALIIQNDDQEANVDFFTTDCEGKLLDDTSFHSRPEGFWDGYVGNLMNLYVDASVEVIEVETNGRGTEGTALFYLDIEARKSGDDFTRKIRADLVFTEVGWKFSRFEELGDER